MIVVDSSVWIDYFRGVDHRATGRLDEALGSEEVVVGDLVLAEVLQGFRRDADHEAAREAMTAAGVVSMLGADAALRSADAYRALRRRGVTVRKTIDTIIATYCVQVGLPLLFRDRDFEPFVEHLGLQEA